MQSASLQHMEQAAPTGTPNQPSTASTLEAAAAGHAGQRDGAHTPESGISASSQVPLEIQEALLPKVMSGYQHPLSPWRRRYLVFLVSVITAFLCADQNLLAPNLSAAAAFFNLNDVQKDTYLGGYLMAAFFLVGAPAALLCGYLADKYNRIWLLVAIIIIGETPCLCTYWVTELWQFFLVRMLTGIAVGGCFPLVYSLLGDLFPISQRSAMAAIVQIAVGAGIGGGQMLAGIIGPATNWRVPFVVMAVPSLLLALLLAFTGKEPPRGGFEEALSGALAAGGDYSETITWAKVRRLLRIPSNWIIVLQGLPGCLPWGVMQTYINDYLHLNKGYSVELSTVVILLFGIGCGIGVIAGGAAGQLLYNWRKESMAILTGVSVLAGAGPVWFLINANLQAVGFGVTLFMSALAGFLVSIAGPNLRAIMINVNTPETRGVSLALQSVTDDLGRGLGPVVVAGFISQLGRQAAFNISVAGWLPCGIMLCCLAITMRRDESAMQRQLADKADVALQQIRVMASSGGGAVVASSDEGSKVDAAAEVSERLGGTAAAAAQSPAAAAAAAGSKRHCWGSSSPPRQARRSSGSGSEGLQSGSFDPPGFTDVTQSGLRGPLDGDRAGRCSSPGSAGARVQASGSTEQLLEMPAGPLSSSDGAVCQDVPGLTGAGTRHRGFHLRGRSSGSSGGNGGATGQPSRGGAAVAEAHEVEEVYDSTASSTAVMTDSMCSLLTAAISSSDGHDLAAAAGGDYEAHTRVHTTCSSRRAAAAAAADAGSGNSSTGHWQQQRKQQQRPSTAAAAAGVSGQHGGGGVHVIARRCSSDGLPSVSTTIL